MDRGDFYIVLPSNAKCLTFDNTSSHFKTDIPKELVLPGRWEVCLHGISYVNSWNTIDEVINDITFESYRSKKKKVATENPDHVLPDDTPMEEGSDGTEAPRGNLRGRVLKDYTEGWIFATPFLYPTTRSRKRTAYIKPGRYNDIGEVLPQINRSLPKWWDNHFGQDRDGFVNVRLDYEHWSLKINPSLAQMLGFRNTYFQYFMQDKDLENPGDTLTYYEDDVELPTSYFPAEKGYCILTAGSRPDIRAYFYNIFVYCNIIEHQIVANAFVPLLRAVPISTTADKYVTANFLHNIYVPLNTNRISTIEIKLCDETGRQIPFEFGKTLVTLHFRKTRKFLE